MQEGAATTSPRMRFIPTIPHGGRLGPYGRRRRRGESAGVYAPTMTMARKLGRLLVPGVAALRRRRRPRRSTSSTGGGRVAFNWSTAKHSRLFTFHARFGDEWASLPPDMQHERSPGALRGLRSSRNLGLWCRPVRRQPGMPAGAGGRGGLYLEWMLECRRARRGMVHFNGTSLAMSAELPAGTHNAQPSRNGVLFNDSEADRLRYAGRAIRPKTGPWRCPGIRHGICRTPSSTTAASRARASHAGLRSCPTRRWLFAFDRGRVRPRREPPARLGNLSMDLRNAIHGLEVWPYD